MEAWRGRISTNAYKEVPSIEGKCPYDTPINVDNI